ncbi:unnamed protein product, partial [Ectocarpus sp. 12 AP-2014]
KGFALIGGILVTAAVQSTMEKSALTMVRQCDAEQALGGGTGRRLAVLTYPPCNGRTTTPWSCLSNVCQPFRLFVDRARCVCVLFFRRCSPPGRCLTTDALDGGSACRWRHLPARQLPPPGP